LRETLELVVYLNYIAIYEVVDNEAEGKHIPVTDFTQEKLHPPGKTANGRIAALIAPRALPKPIFRRGTESDLRWI
jgi:hypothetical protein